MYIYLLYFLAGGLLGCILTRLVIHFQTGHGFFTVSPVKDADGFYSVNVSLRNDENIFQKNYILLKKDINSHR